jgi:putative sugar O-methyltransferase
VVRTRSWRVLEVARQLKSRFLRHSRYRPQYPYLNPPDYSRAAFQAEARLASQLYTRMLEAIGRQRLDAFDAHYCHPAWLDAKRRFAESLGRGLRENFLDDPVLRPQMVRRGWTALQAHEKAYLESRPPELGALLRSFTESRVGGPHLECASYRCSSNSIGHLYYLARMLEAFPAVRARSHTVLEIGGGYGNFGRVYLDLLPATAYVIVDFPEFVALQNLFLRLNHVRTVVCRSARHLAPRSGWVHLVPVQMVPMLQSDADMFVSHFALSETPRVFQALIAEKRFFGASWMYMTGQYTGRQPRATWEPHAFLHADVRNQFDSVEIQDFPVAWAYELTAERNETSATGSAV